MMALEKQACSLELSQRLKELGLKQESLFEWFYGGMGVPEVIPRGKVINQILRIGCQPP
jgi:hypothetical protein